MRLRLTESNHKLAEIILRGVVNIISKLAMVFVRVCLLHSSQVCFVPVYTNQSTYEQLIADLFFFVMRGDVADSMVQQHGIADRLIDAAVQDVSRDFSL